MMAEKPILFCGDMVRAILDGSKTQTRRAIKTQPPAGDYVLSTLLDSTCRDTRRHIGKVCWLNRDDPSTPCSDYFAPPYAVGDVLLVREAFRTMRKYDDLPPSALSRDVPIQFEADDFSPNWPPRPRSPIGRYRAARFMPRFVARLFLRVNDVRVQRVQDISEADAQAEGIQRLNLGPNEMCGWPVHPFTSSYRDAYAKLWDTLNLKRGFSWASNPWVFAYTFERIEK